MHPHLRLVLVFVALVAAFLPRRGKADDWDLNKATKPEGGDIVKLCETGGSRTRYSNVPVPGYEPCGTLKTKAVCDAEGKKLIISADAEGPYGYLDCALGPRITIERHDPLPEENAPKDTGLQALGDKAWIVGGRPPERDRAAWSNYQTHVKALDRLLNDKNAKPKAAKAPSVLSPAGPDAPAGTLTSLLGAAESKELERLLKSLQTSGGAGDNVFGDELQKQLKELFPDK